ncbi:MAG: hypothetical protein Q8K32_18000 [Archangium sp.]|nr:hypothetical protein [Archangium sp.]
MRTRLTLCALLLSGTFAAASPRRTYVVNWGTTHELSAEDRALIEKCDRQLRAELLRRGATVTDRKDARTAIVLRPTLEVLPQGLKLDMVGMRNADKKLLGSVSVKAGGASRDAQLRAIVKHVCSEAAEF